MKLLKTRVWGEFKQFYHPSYGSTIEFCFNPFDVFIECMEINLPDVRVYQAIALGCYNIKATRKDEHVIKYRGSVKIKPEFIDQILESLREQEHD